jgi:hypothetical protein
VFDGLRRKNAFGTRKCLIVFVFDGLVPRVPRVPETLFFSVHKVYAWQVLDFVRSEELNSLVIKSFYALFRKIRRNIHGGRKFFGGCERN